MQVFTKLSAWFLALAISLISPCLLPVSEAGGSAFVEETAQEATIMTFNLYVSGIGKKSPENRTDEVVTVIRQQLPDSFGVQEADEGWMRRLEEALPEYSHVGVGRNKDFSGECSAVFYLNDKYSVADSGTLWLSPTPDTPSRGWDAWINRVCTWAVLENRETGFRYAHFNAHFDNSGAISRLNAVAVVSERIAQFNDIPVVFTGDLNAKEDTVMYDRIISTGLRDSKLLAQETDSGRTYHGYAALSTDGLPIDYVFVNNGVSGVGSYSIIREKINGIYPSDHFPISVRLRMINGKEDERK